ncbi:MAG: hypothetical protein Q9193_000851 [Seirophora villosa]
MVEKSAVYYASLSGLMPTLGFLLNVGKKNLDAVGGPAGTPLQAACARGHEEIFARLMWCEADLTVRGGVFYTALNAAAYFGRYNMVKAIFQCQTVTDLFPDYGFDIDARADDGSTPLFLAIIEDRIAVAEPLTRQGAVVDIAVNSGVTPSAVAIEHGSDQLVKDLITRGASPSDTDYYGMTCIDCLKRQRPHLLTLPSIALKLGNMVSGPDIAILRRNTSRTAAEVRIHHLEDNGPRLSRLSKDLLMLGMENDARLAYQGKLLTLQHSSTNVICDGCITK